MGKIVCIMGKSSTGKDTIFKQLLKEDGFEFKTIVSYTTRPIRESEQEGVEYHFVAEEDFQRFSSNGKIIEERSYDTCHGLWRYFLVDDGQINLEESDYITIGTLESFKSLRKYFGKDCVVPVLIELDDGVRLQRALNRERKQDNPKYDEMCRRFLADAKDFDNELIKQAKISKRFKNEDLNTCLSSIRQYLKIELA